MGLHIRAGLDCVEQTVSPFMLGRVEVEILAATRTVRGRRRGLSKQLRINQKRLAIHLEPSPLLR